MTEQEEFEFRSRAEAEAQTQTQQPKSGFQTLMDASKGADATTGIKEAAPSNVLRDVGIASANAPGMTGMIVNSIPGMGNPSQIMPSLRNVQNNPNQGMNALKRVIATKAGNPLLPQEKKPALAGTLAGTAIEMMAPNLSRPNIKATGPFTAGFKAPETALPGSFESAGSELTAAKGAARAGEDLKDTARLRALLGGGPAKVQKLAEEGKAAIEGGQDIPVTRLLAYRDALGKAQAEGGTFAGDYKAARDAATELLRTKAPDLVDKLEKMSLNFLAKGNPKRTFPWFTFALDPKVGLAKTATLPIVRNVAGAVAGKAYQNLPKISSALNSAFQGQQ